MAPLAPIITPAFLTAIRRHPHLPKHSWYFVTATALSILNRPDEIPKIYKDAIDNWPEATSPTETNGMSGNVASDANGSAPVQDAQLTISRRMREALIKSAAVGGLPKVTLAPLPATSDSLSTPNATVTNGSV
jgi:hypothetical protein